jgi:signal peptidase
MSPELEPGDMIITRRLEPEEIGIGDVVSYRLAAGTLVTHRVTDIVRENGRLRFQTKGDANNTVDPKLIDSGEIVGIYLFKIPKGGYIADLMRTPFAALLLIVVPALLLTGSGLKKLCTKIN